MRSGRASPAEPLRSGRNTGLQAHTHIFIDTVAQPLTGRYQCCCGQQVAVCWPACLDPDNSRSITPWKLRSDHRTDRAAHSLSLGHPASQLASLRHGAKEDHSQGSEESRPLLLEEIVKYKPHDGIALFFFSCLPKMKQTPRGFFRVSEYSSKVC